MRAGPFGLARIFFARAAVAAAALALAPAALAQPASAQQQSGQLTEPDSIAIDAFYRERGGQPLWLGGMESGPAEQLLALLDRADLDGLDPRNYRSDGLERAMRSAWGGLPERLGRGRSSIVSSLRGLRPGPT